MSYMRVLQNVAIQHTIESAIALYNVQLVVQTTLIENKKPLCTEYTQWFHNSNEEDHPSHHFFASGPQKRFLFYVHL